MSKRNVFPSFAEKVRQKQLAARHAEMDAFAAVPAASDKAEDEVLAAGLPAWNLEPPSTPVRRRRQ